MVKRWSFYGLLTYGAAAIADPVDGIPYTKGESGEAKGDTE
jgi:hypothetical protein